MQLVEYVPLKLFKKVCVCVFRRNIRKESLEKEFSLRPSFLSSDTPLSFRDGKTHWLFNLIILLVSYTWRGFWDKVRRVSLDLVITSLWFPVTSVRSGCTGRVGWTEGVSKGPGRTCHVGNSGMTNEWTDTRVKSGHVPKTLRPDTERDRKLDRPLHLLINYWIILRLGSQDFLGTLLTGTPLRPLRVVLGRKFTNSWYQHTGLPWSF